MTEQERNLATFRNLCIMAYADGDIHENEIAVLAELAGILGLDADQANQIMNQGGSGDFYIPDTEAECQNEIRRVVLIMLTDGEIHPKEYQQCLRLAKAMNISQEYLDEVIQLYISRQKEHEQHLGIFQNLFLIAVADGSLSPEEEEFLKDVAANLGLSQQDVDNILENHQSLDFIIPEDDEEKYFSLKNLVYMMVVDGDIEESEYKLCLNFAERVGMGRKEIEEILTEYENIQKRRERDQSDIDSTNIDICLDVFLNLNKIPLSTFEILDLLHKATRTRNLDFSLLDNELYTYHFFQFMWLIYIRASALSREHKSTLPILLNLAYAQGNFRDLRDHILQLEQEHGATEIPIYEMGTDALKAEILDYLDRY